MHFGTLLVISVNPLHNAPVELPLAWSFSACPHPLLVLAPLLTPLTRASLLLLAPQGTGNDQRESRMDERIDGQTNKQKERKTNRK